MGKIVGLVFKKKPAGKQEPKAPENGKETETSKAPENGKETETSKAPEKPKA